MLKKLNFPMVILVAYLARLLITGSLFLGDSIVIIALAALYGFNLFLEHNRQEPVNEQVKEDLAQLKTQVSALNNAAQINKLKRF